MEFVSFSLAVQAIQSAIDETWHVCSAPVRVFDAGDLLLCGRNCLFRNSKQALEIASFNGIGDLFESTCCFFADSDEHGGSPLVGG